MAAAPRPLLLPLLLFTAAVGALLWSSLKLAGVPVGPVHLGILVYFGLASLLLHRWQEGGLEGRPMLFQQRFMAGLVIKMQHRPRRDVRLRERGGVAVRGRRHFRA